MKLRVIIYLVLLCLYSCDNQKKQDKLISNNQTKYWDVISPRENNRACINGYCFHKNGIYQIFYYYESKRFNDEAIDIVFDRSWKTLNDSFFILSKKKLRILSLTEDTFIFQGNDNKIIKLVASKNQTDSLSKENPFKNFIIWDTLQVVSRKISI